MNLKRLKFIIIILIILTVIILISLFAIKQTTENTATNDFSDDDGYIPQKVDTTLQDINVYVKIKNHLGMFMLYKNAGNKTAIEDITGNSNSFYELTSEYNQPIMLDVVYRTGDTMYNVNFVKFRFYKQANSYYAVVVLDRENGTYKISESNSAEYENAKIGKIDDKYNGKTPIEQKKYNKIKDNAQLTDEDIINEYFRDYIQKALYYPQEAYFQLDETYRQKRFGSFAKFQEYLSENKSKLESLDIYSEKELEDFATEEEYEYYMNTLEEKGLAKYKVEMDNGFTEYICIDDYGDYYIFKVKGAMKYSVYLDEYTVELPTLIEDYNKMTSIEKATQNVRKFLKAVYNKDYTYAYSKLSEDFKNNYLNTEEKFIAYISNNWIQYEDIETVNVEIKSGLYLCTVKTKEGKQKQFIMKLEEGTDFVMSFGI